MKLVSPEYLFLINGGNHSAIVVCASTYILASNILSAANNFANFGQQIGETTYNHLHPDVLGQMVYTPEDFQEKK
jgi:hypothetical protein